MSPMRTKTHEKLAAGQRSRRTDPVHERDTIRVVSVREDEQTGTCRMLSLPKLGQGDRNSLELCEPVYCNDDNDDDLKGVHELEYTHTWKTDGLLGNSGMIEREEQICQGYEAKVNFVDDVLYYEKACTPYAAPNRRAGAAHTPRKISGEETRSTRNLIKPYEWNSVKASSSHRSPASTSSSSFSQISTPALTRASTPASPPELNVHMGYIHILDVPLHTPQFIPRSPQSLAMMRAFQAMDLRTLLAREDVAPLAPLRAASPPLLDTPVPFVNAVTEAADRAVPAAGLGLCYSDGRPIPYTSGFGSASMSYD